LLSSSAAYAQTPQVEPFLFTEYGIYTVDRDVQGRDVLGINRAAASNVRHAATLRTIPAQIGTTFGFRIRSSAGRMLRGSSCGKSLSFLPQESFPPPPPPKSPSRRMSLCFKQGSERRATPPIRWRMPSSSCLETGFSRFGRGNRKLATQSFRIEGETFRVENVATAPIRGEGHGAELLGKRGQQLLRHPAGPNHVTTMPGLKNSSIGCNRPASRRMLHRR
jgi:hypothetical protein